MKNVLVIGGGGYVGSALVPSLMKKGFNVTVLDLFWYWKKPFQSLRNKINFKAFYGDIRDRETLDMVFKGQDAVIHLACISNDPSFELDPALGRSINYDSFKNILEMLKKHKPKRFIYASSSSVYGIKEIKNVTEDMSCEPLTDYSKFKLMCENDLKSADIKDTCWTIIRPATLCGYAPRLRLDLSVNILTIHALVKGKMTILGGDQLRPNLNIKDMVDCYVTLLLTDAEKINGQIFNVGYENKSILDISSLVRTTLNKTIEVQINQSNDKRSYHINSDKIDREIGFVPRYTIKDAINSLLTAYNYGLITKPLENQAYYNVRTMKKMEESGVR